MYQFQVNISVMKYINPITQIFSAFPTSGCLTPTLLLHSQYTYIETLSQMANLLPQNFEIVKWKLEEFANSSRLDDIIQPQFHAIPYEKV